MRSRQQPAGSQRVEKSLYGEKNNTRRVKGDADHAFAGELQTLLDKHGERHKIIIALRKRVTSAAVGNPTAIKGLLASHPEISREFITDKGGILNCIRSDKFLRFIKGDEIPTEEELLQVALDFGMPPVERASFLQRGLAYIAHCETLQQKGTAVKHADKVTRISPENFDTQLQAVLHGILEKRGVVLSTHVMQLRNGNTSLHPVTPGYLKDWHSLNQAGQELIRGVRPKSIENRSIKADRENLEIILVVMKASDDEKTLARAAFEHDLAALAIQLAQEAGPEQKISKKRGVGRA